MGRSSPAGKTWIWKAPSVAAATWAAKVSAAPKIVSSVRGKPEVSRQAKVGADWAMAGAASAVAPAPMAAVVRNWRLFTVFLPVV